MFDRKQHWETIYETKELKDVSWYQPKPKDSLGFFDYFKLAKTAKIIDIGGGDSFLVDHLLELGFEDVTVLDISANAIERAKKRLGTLAQKVTWIIADVTTFQPTEKYDFWHDRAAFHFLTAENDISTYVDTVQKSLNPSGILVIGAFSDQGPTKCSGIEIKQYTESTMTDLFGKKFKKEKCFNIDHKTPFDTTQNFIFCSFVNN